jgi:competence protein ComEC
MITVVFWISMAVHSIFGITYVNNVFLSSLLAAFDFTARMIDRIPFSYMVAASPTAPQTALFYTVAALVRYRMLRRRSEELMLFLSTVCVCLAVVVSAGYIGDIGKLSVMFVNVGQGDASVVSLAYRDCLLIDGGGSAVYSSFNLGRYVYVPFLQSKGIRRAHAIVTHYHKDHCQGIAEAMKSLKIDTLYMPDCDPDNEYRIQLLDLAEQYGTRVEFMRCGDSIEFKSGIKVEFISPDDADLQSSDLNETSLSAYVTYGRFSALFTGDATKAQESKMLKRGLIRKCDIFKAAHHGSDTSNSSELIQAASPKAVIISVGEDNTYDLPDDEVLERFNGMEIARTDENGNITVLADKNGIRSIKAFK